MACVQRLILFLLVSLFFCSAVRAGEIAPDTLWTTQAEAFSACSSYAASVGGSCVPWGALVSDLGARAECIAVNPAVSHWAGAYRANNSAGGLDEAYYWCVPSDCSVYDSGYSGANWSGAYDDNGVYCSGGCMSIFHGYSGIYQACVSGGGCTSQGHFSGNGNRCASQIDASLFSSKPDDMTCDHSGLSCYNKDKGFCATTESGEQVCAPMPPAGSGDCASGATGATCVGNGAAPPSPTDPPIPKGQAPDSSSTTTGKDTGGTVNNYTQNNYSGTSPGSGGSFSSSDSSTGSQSNQNGSGNSSGPSGDHGTDSNGKCSDGSVPTASGCSGTFTDTNCDTPPQCFGDAVLCGQAKELWAIKCNTAKLAASSSSTGDVGTASDALAAAGVPADGGASGDPSSSGLVTSTDIGQDGFDASGLGFSRTCPANPTFEVFGRTYTFDLTPFCNFAGLLGWIVLLVAFLAGLKIVATGRA